MELLLKLNEPKNELNKITSKSSITSPEFEAILQAQRLLVTCKTRNTQMLRDCS